MTTETTEPKQLRRSTRVAAKRDAEEPAAPVEVKKPAAKKAKTAKPDTKPAEDSSDAGEESNLSVGDSLPEGIVLKDHDGNDVDVSEVVKTGTVVIFGKYHTRLFETVPIRMSMFMIILGVGYLMY